MDDVRLYELLPEKNRVDIPIPLNRFLKSGGITTTEEKRFSRYFISATLRYVFREKNGDLEGIVHPQNGELHILEIQIRTRSMGWYDLLHFAVSVKQAYPHNLLLVLKYQDAYSFFAGLSHVNSRNANKDVVDKMRGSGWITPDTTTSYSKSYNELDYYEPFERYPFNRAINERLWECIHEGKTMEQIMGYLCYEIEKDKKAWTYYYHRSEDYFWSSVAIHEAEYYDPEGQYDDDADLQYDYMKEDGDEENVFYNPLDEKWYDPFGGDRYEPLYVEEDEC